jgi:hypothetical protein
LNGTKSASLPGFAYSYRAVSHWFRVVACFYRPMAYSYRVMTNSYGGIVWHWQDYAAIWLLESSLIAGVWFRCLQQKSYCFRYHRGRSTKFKLDSNTCINWLWRQEFENVRAMTAITDIWELNDIVCRQSELSIWVSLCNSHRRLKTNDFIFIPWDNDGLLSKLSSVLLLKVFCKEYEYRLVLRQFETEKIKSEFFILWMFRPWFLFIEEHSQTEAKTWPIPDFSTSWIWNYNCHFIHESILPHSQSPIQDISSNCGICWRHSWNWSYPRLFQSLVRFQRKI